MSHWLKIVEFARKRVDSYPPEYKERLEFEFKEIDKQGANDYWLNLLKTRQKFDVNPNGLVLPFLLGITTVDPIKAEHNYVVNEEGESGEVLEIFLDNGQIAHVPIQAIVKLRSGPTPAKDLKIGDELT
jgi:hypothetical protein